MSESIKPTMTSSGVVKYFFSLPLALVSHQHSLTWFHNLFIQIHPLVNYNPCQQSPCISPLQPPSKSRSKTSMDLRPFAMQTNRSKLAGQLQTLTRQRTIESGWRSNSGSIVTRLMRPRPHRDFVILTHAGR